MCRRYLATSRLLQRTPVAAATSGTNQIFRSEVPKRIFIIVGLHSTVTINGAPTKKGGT